MRRVLTAMTLSREDVPRGHMATQEGDHVALHCFEADESMLIAGGDAVAVDYCPSCGARYARTGVIGSITSWLPSLPKTALVYSVGVSILFAATVLPVSYGAGTTEVSALQLADAGQLLVIYLVVSVLIAKWSDVVSEWVNGGGA